MNQVERRDAAVPDVAPASAADIVADLERFEDTVLGQLAAVGLPTDDVLVDLTERHILLSNVGTALTRLPVPDRGRSAYVSKMIVAAAVGLFDAALNYLWDETVNELRRRVTDYDIGYFYDVAILGDMRKHFGGPEDLPRVQDVDLLRACREIGLLSSEGYQQVDHVRYMRNHASAAHPNQVSLTGLQLATWLETCIRQVITLPQDSITANTGRLLANIKADRLAPENVSATAIFFAELPQDRADTLASGLFGLYTATNRTAIVADNVRMLWPELWEFVSDDTRYAFGTRFGRFQANAETSLATAARELLDLVDGSKYLPDQIRTVEIDAAVDTLISAHNGWDNFYNEVAPARALERLIGDQGNIPQAVATKFIHAVVTTFLGNGSGVSTAAVPSYVKMLASVDPQLAGVALRAFQSPEISSILRTSVGRRQWNELLSILDPKLTRRSDRDLYDAIKSFSGTPDQLRLDESIKRLAGAKHRRSTSSQ